MAASLFQRRTDSVFLFSLQCPGIETMVETVRASRNASAELSFAPHHVGADDPVRPSPPQRKKAPLDCIKGSCHSEAVTEGIKALGFPPYFTRVCP